MRGHTVAGSAHVAPAVCGRRFPIPPSLAVSSYKVEQCRVQYRGRNFHFVSYEGQPANGRRGELAVPPMWYLMGPGRRWPVMPQVVGQPEAEIEEALVAWLRDQGIGRSPDL
jgi:hypothetical protein